MSTEKKEKMITITTSEGVKEIPENTKLDFEPMVFKPFGKTTRINSAALAKAIRIQFQKKFHYVDGNQFIQPSRCDVGKGTHDPQEIRIGRRQQFHDHQQQRRRHQ